MKISETQFSRDDERELESIYAVYDVNGYPYCIDCALDELFHDDYALFREAVLAPNPTLKDADGDSIGLETEYSSQYALEHPYLSDGLFCTKCEAEIFPSLESEN